MDTPSSQVLSTRLGIVVAPAGCGKTHLLADALKSSALEKPVLVLTHTNAGVSALRRRLQKASVPPTNYRLSTIDGWALRLASSFPLRSGVSPSALALTDHKNDYPQIREAAARLLAEGHLADCLTASYSRLLVDEYQDCSIRQHELVCQASTVLPTCVMGDHLQAIFGLSGEDPLVPWAKVEAFYPRILALNHPWRWVNAGCRKLGEWLITTRQQLENGESIDLREAPANVKWVELKGDATDQVKMINAAKWIGRGSTDGVVIVGDSVVAASRHWLASKIQGSEVVEPVDLKDMIAFFRTFDLTHANALTLLLTFGEELMNGLGRAQLLKRVESLKNLKARKSPSEVESCALNFERLRTPASAAGVLMALKADLNVRVYRHTVLQGSIRTFLNAATSLLDLHQSCIEIREQFRSFGRPLPPRAVGSTLLLKGLEAGAVVILNAHELDARNLYVAFTRGSKAVVVCSRSAVLKPGL